MSSSNPKVICHVDQCTHWMSGDQCMAGKIAVYNEEAGEASDKAADTQCKSFHPGRGVGDYVGALHNANVGGTLKAAFVDGTQITPAVDCYVNSCQYWQEENYCNASAIEINGRQAAKTSDTDCETFAAK
ncbi:MAG: DUF1540 domain-containing protein [Negativicutes bacterium]|nr:DUF1540 domain-containing protein [Negativicutes bacterium]